MAKKFLTPINVLNLPSDPASGNEGDIYYNTSSDVLRIYANASWTDVSSGGGGGGVTSLTGTANEIEVSASTGAVTISLPTTINANTTGSAATLTTSRTIALTGDVTGSASFNGGSNASITATVVDDSHNHIVSNVDGLQTALDAKADDNAVVHLAGTETITGAKTFSASVSGTDIVLSGSLTAVSKSFDIEHPTKENMRLRYGSLEGPENGVYVRGKSKSSTITLPDYWIGLVDEDSITVQLTPIGKHKNLYVKDISNNTVIVGGVEGEFFYFIQAERKDIDKLVVEYGG